MKLPLMAQDSDRYILNNQYCERLIYIGKGRSPGNPSAIVTVQEFRTGLIRYSSNCALLLECTYCRKMDRILPNGFPL